MQTKREERERIRISFLKVKEDISLLKEAIELIGNELKKINYSLSLRQVLDQSKESLSLNLEKKESKSKPAEKIIKKAEKKIVMNMKRMIKKEILSIIEQKKLITISYLQTIICEEKQLCSRASFFNYMKDLREEGSIINETLDGQRVTKINEGSEIKEIQKPLDF